MKGIDHLVLCGRNLDRMRAAYGALGFTLTPKARHPFGTGNSLVQLDGCFLELLAVLDAATIPEHRPGHFSFAAFNRDFLSAGEGFSMLVLDSVDARADIARWQALGLHTYAPFDFSRKAKLPSGEEVTVGFSLAFATHPELPRTGFFTCEQQAPQHFWKAEYQRHANTAVTILEVCLVAEDRERIQTFICRFVDAPLEQIPGGSKVRTARGDILIVGAQAFADRYGVAAPSLTHGGRFAGYAVGLSDTHFIENLGARRLGGSWIVPPDDAFGTAIAFRRLNGQEQPA